MAQAHPLENKWSFWEHRKNSGKNRGSAYSGNMFEIGNFQTVEDFWRFKNNLPLPSEIFHTPDSERMKFADREIEGYSLFKTGIRPEWEDEANKKGGEFFCRKTFSSKDLDDIYENLLLGLIGETIDPENYICGCRVVDKSARTRVLYRVEVWFKEVDEEKKKILQQNIRSCLGQDILHEYRPHGEAMRKFR